MQWHQSTLKLRLFDIKLLAKASVAALLILTSCTAIAGASTIQSLAIDHYDNAQQNAALAEDLVYYDPHYLSHKIPAYTREIQQQIQIGYFVENTDNVSYRIAYHLKEDKNTQQSLEQLKKDFADFIPKLAAQHASKNDLFTQLVPVGNDWLDSLFTQPVDSTLEKSSEILQFSIDDQQLGVYLDLVKRHYGKPTHRSYQRSQFYEAFNKTPESVSLFYLQHFSKGRTLTIRLSVHENDGQWQVMGFNILGANTRLKNKP